MGSLELQKLLKLKNDQIVILESIIDKIAEQISNGRWDLIDRELKCLLNKEKKPGGVEGGDKNGKNHRF